MSKILSDTGSQTLHLLLGGAMDIGCTNHVDTQITLNHVSKVDGAITNTYARFLILYPEHTLKHLMFPTQTGSGFDWEWEVAFRQKWDWIWASVGNVGRGGYLLVFVKILHAKVMKEWFFIYKVECWFKQPLLQETSRSKYFGPITQQSTRHHAHKLQLIYILISCIAHLNS